MAEKKTVYTLEFKSNIDDITKQIEKDIKTVDKSYDKLTRASKEYNAEAEKTKIQEQQITLARRKRIREDIKLANEAKELIVLAKKEVKSEQELIRYNALLVKKRKQMVVVTKQERKEYDRLTITISKNNRTLIKSDKNIGRFYRNVGNYANALKGLAGTIGLAGLGIAAVQLFKSSTEAYKQQALVVAKLNTVLKQRTNATDEQVESLLMLTAAQQEQGIIGDEIQIAGAQQLATFVNQTESVEALIPAMNDLLAQQKGVNASQGDAVNIGNLFGKVLTGQVGALSKVGISFSEAEQKILKFGTESERASTLAEVITNNIGDMNKELAATDAGQIKNAENRLGDMSETLGKRLIPAVGRWKSALAGALGFLLDITKVKMADQLEEEQKTVNELTTALTNTNLSLDDRKGLLQELKDINPDIVKGLNAESINYDILRANVEEYNKAMVNRIILANLGDEQEKKLSRSTQITFQLKQKEFNLSKLILDNNEDLAFSEASLEEKVISLTKELGNKEKQDYKTLKTIASLQKNSEDLIDLREQEKESLKDVTAIDAQIAAMQKMFGVTEELITVNEDLADTTDDENEQAKKRKKYLDDLKKQKTEEERLVKVGQAESIKLAEQDVTSKKLLRDTEFDNIKFLTEKELQAYVDLNKAILEDSLNVLDLKLDYGLITQEKYNDEIKKLQIDSRKAITDLNIQHLEDEYQLKLQALHQLNIAENANIDKTAEDKRTKAQEQAELELQESQLLYEKKEQILQLQYDNGLISKGEFDFKMANLRQESAENEINIEQTKSDKLIKINKIESDAKLKELEKFHRYSSKILDIAGNFAEARKNQELKAAGDNEAKRDAIEAKYAKKRKERALIQIALDTAIALSKVWIGWAAFGPAAPIGVGFETGLILGNAIAQTALIASTPLAEGGLAQGPAHAQGGIPYGANTIEGNEYIINKASTEAFYPLIDSINNAGNGQGRTEDVSGLNIIDYDKLAGLINDKQVYVTTKDINESLDDDSELKVQSTL